MGKLQELPRSRAAEGGRLLNIMSAGHSGSTTLNMLLGQMPGFFAAGELLRLTWQLGRDPDEADTLCTCGASFRDCSVWGQVIPPHAFEDPGKFRLAFLQLQEWRSKAGSRRERALQLIYRWTTERGLETGFIRPFHAREIASRNLDLVDRIAEVTGASVIIDSTKGLERYHLLNRFRPYTTIVLVRDPRGLAASAIKYGRDPLRVVDAWLRLYRRIIRFLKANKVQPIVVSYEDMCSAPEAVQKRIAALFEVSDAMNDLHLVAGNPSRYRRPFVIKEDRSWEAVLPDEIMRHFEARGNEIAAVRAQLLELDSGRRREPVIRAQAGGQGQAAGGGPQDGPPEHAGITAN